MRSFRYVLVFSVIAALGGGLATAQPPNQPAKAQKQATPQGMTEAEALKDIQATMGFVPQWMRALPSQMLPSFWMTMKTFEMADTRLERKTKELIGLAVAAQIPCEYCVVYHTENAKLLGASEQEVKEAIGMAAVTREASTLLNGLQIDKKQFKKDLDRGMRAQQQARK